MRQRDTHVMVPQADYDRLVEAQRGATRSHAFRNTIVILVCVPVGLLIVIAALSVPFLVWSLIESQSIVRDIASASLEARRPSDSGMNGDQIIVGLMVFLGGACVLRGIFR